MATGKSDDEDIVRFLSLGANDYVVKPINIPVLRARIDVHLSLKNTEDELRESSQKLEQRVIARTAKLLAANEALEKEIILHEQTEQALQKSHVLYRKAENIGQLGHWEWDNVQNRYETISVGVADIVGVSPDKVRELYGNERGISLIHPEDLQYYKSTLEQSLKNGEDYDIEVRIIRQDGQLLWIHEVAEAVMDESGRVVRVIGTIQDITDSKLKSDDIRLSRQRLRNLTTQLYAARESERALVAREIHDELGQLLTRLKMDLSWLVNRIPSHWIKLPKRIESMIVLVDSTIDFVRKLASSLRPALLDKVGLEAAIEWYIQEFVGHADYKYTLDLKTHGHRPDKERDTAIFRIFQEAITNIVRHAEADQIRMSLYQLDSKLMLTVADNGTGIKEDVLQSPDSIGLIGMRERAGEFGGHVQIEPINTGGTQVTVTMPVEDQKS